MKRCVKSSDVSAITIPMLNKPMKIIVVVGQTPARGYISFFFISTHGKNISLFIAMP